MLRSLAVIALVFLLASSLSSQEETKKAASFSLKDIDNKEVVLDSLLGKGPIVVDFWATWCKPCIIALDHVRDIYREYKDRGLTVVAINEDDPRNVAKVKPMVASHRWDFCILMDPDKDVKRLYHVAAFPTTFVLDHEGNLVNRHVGYVPGNEKELKKEIEDLLLPERSESDSSRVEEGGETEGGSQ
jgi:cytochrome c biogenesis protein CcmG/thiol:disulfide interchange protein DsbE